MHPSFKSLKATSYCFKCNSAIPLVVKISALLSELPEIDLSYSSATSINLQ